MELSVADVFMRRLPELDGHFAGRVAEAEQLPSAVHEPPSQAALPEVSTSMLR